MSDTSRCLACMSAMRGSSVCPSCGWVSSCYADNPLYLPAGHLLHGRYTVGQVIGVGGFGIVYIAWDNNLDIRVAIKEFLPKEYAARSPNHVSITPYTGSAHEDFSLGVGKFLDEAKALARFQDHPGIVTVHESFRANNTAYMVMQYLDGMTLKEYLKRQPGEKIAFALAVKTMTPVMDALREVHNAGFVHRDISPDNIFLTNQKQVKLLDFGSARYAIGEHSKSLTSVLKHGYAPVEQYSTKGNQGPWSDVYAVCATLYRCVTGFVPPDAMERVQGDSIRSPKQLGIDMSAGGEWAIMKGLSLKAVDRFENIQQLQRAFTVEDAIIVCKKCGTKNRVQSLLRLKNVKCGKCGCYLFSEDIKQESADNWDNRICCGDGACTGIIDSTGKCTQCGKSYEQGIHADKTNKEEINRQQRSWHKSSSKYEKKIIYGMTGSVFLLLLVILMNLNSQSTPTIAPAPKPLTAPSPEKKTITQANPSEAWVPLKKRKAKRPSVHARSSVLSPQRSTPISNENLIRVGKYWCTRTHFNRANELDPTDDEKRSLDIEREYLSSLKQQIRDNFVDRYSQVSIDQHNMLARDFNSRRIVFNENVKKYNTKVTIYNNYLMNNCRKAN